MSEDRKQADWAIMIIVAGLVTCLVLGAYVGCYFWRSEVVIRRGNVRVFRNKLEADLFEPARLMESWLRGEPVGRGTDA
jgi:hypothetical protein